MPWTYSIDWNDGSPIATGSVATQGATITGSHTFTRRGTFTVRVIVTDKDGAASAPGTASVTVKDDTPPVIVVDVAGTKGTNDWYTSDVTVKWTVTDAESPITSAPCTDVTLTTNTSGTTYTCSATSEGGTTTKSVTVKRDNSPPVVTGAAAGPLGTGGWYKGNVTVSWSATDDMSPVAAVPCVPSTLTTNADNTTYSCTATNDAGLSATSNITVRRDASIPVVTPTATGTPGTNGWFISTVSLAWGVTGGGPSGVSITNSCNVQTLSTDTPGAPFACTATTGAGIATTGNITIKRDVTPPVVTPTVTGPAGNGGWYRGDVTVSWSATDNVATVAAVPCAANTLSTDNAGTAYNCSATNAAGLTATATQTVKRDATNPLIGYTGNAGSYTIDQTVAITCAASDVMSLLATTTCANVTGAGYTFPLGTTSFSASAVDNAGNTSSASGLFTMSVTQGSLCALVERWTSNAGVANSLCVKLTHGDYEPFRNEVNAQSGKKIDADKAAILLRLVSAL